MAFPDSGVQSNKGNDIYSSAYRALFQYKDRDFTYTDPHKQSNTVSRPYYLFTGNSNTDSFS